MKRNLFVLLRIFCGAVPGALDDLYDWQARSGAAPGGRLAFKARCIGRLGALLGPAGSTDAATAAAGTALQLFVIARAMAAIGNGDRVGRFTASNLADGTVVLAIGGGPRAGIAVSGHRLRYTRAGRAGENEAAHAVMEFKDLSTARALFEGKVNALACVGKGDITMRGNLGMLDNVNRLLDRVAVYLG